MRYQGIAWFIDNDLVVCDDVMEPFAREGLGKASASGRVVLIMDQTKASDRHQILMLSLRFGERALPLAWRVEAPEGAIGFAVQKELLKAVAPWLPQQTEVCPMADRFHGTPDLIAFAIAKGWGMPRPIQRSTKKPATSTHKPEPQQIILAHPGDAPHRQAAPVRPANPATLGSRLKLMGGERADPSGKSRGPKTQHCSSRKRAASADCATGRRHHFRPILDIAFHFSAPSYFFVFYKPNLSGAKAPRGRCLFFQYTVIYHEFGVNGGISGGNFPGGFAEEIGGCLGPRYRALPVPGNGVATHIPARSAAFAHWDKGSDGTHAAP